MIILYGTIKILGGSGNTSKKIRTDGGRIIFSDKKNIFNEKIRLDEFVIIPNHMHRIIIIDKSNIKRHGPVETQNLASLQDTIVETLQVHYIPKFKTPLAITSDIPGKLQISLIRISPHSSPLYRFAPPVVYLRRTGVWD